MHPFDVKRHPKVVDGLAIKSYIDTISPIDYKASRLNRNEARKQITKIMSQHPEGVRFSRHAHEELEKDDLTTVDALNVLKSPDSKILADGELEKGSYRYRLETKNILVVIGFQEDGAGLTVITAWRKGGAR